MARMLLYQRQSAEGQDVRHRFCLETYLCIVISAIMAAGFLFCIALFISSVNSWDTKRVLLAGVSTLLILGIVALQIAGIIEMIKTDMIITAVSLMDDKTVIIDYVRGRKRYSKGLPCAHINSSVGPISVFAALNIRFISYGITITNYGFIELRQRIKNNQDERNEIEKIHDAIIKICSESYYKCENMAIGQG